MKKATLLILAGTIMVLTSFGVAYADAEVLPEPTTMALLGLGLAGLAGAGIIRRRKK